MSLKKRLAIVIVISLASSIMLAMPVFASAGGSDSGFDLWDLLVNLGDFLYDMVAGILDGIGGIMRDFGSFISGLFKSLLSVLKSIGNAILYALSKVIDVLGEVGSFLLDGLKKLFVPSKEFFSNFRDDILSAYNKKFGSLFSSLSYLDTRFKGLSPSKYLLENFKVTFPKESFLSGLTVDLIVAPYDVFVFIRVCLTGLYCISTVIIIYHKAIDMAGK